MSAAARGAGGQGAARLPPRSTGRAAAGHRGTRAGAHVVQQRAAIARQPGAGTCAREVVGRRADQRRGGGGAPGQGVPRRPKHTCAHIHVYAHKQGAHPFGCRSCSHLRPCRRRQRRRAPPPGLSAIWNRFSSRRKYLSHENGVHRNTIRISAPPVPTRRMCATQRLISDSPQID